VHEASVLQVVRTSALWCDNQSSRRGLASVASEAHASGSFHLYRLAVPAILQPFLHLHVLV
jgi:hypothetical protein